MEFKDWWKSKPSWLKGGIIAIIALVILYIILMIFSAKSICEFNTQENINCTNAQILSTFLLPVHSTPFIQGTLVVILITFMIGAIIGLITSKIKSKK